MFLSKAEVELTGSSSWEEVVLCGGAVFSVEKPAHFQSSHPMPQRRMDPCTMPGLYTLILVTQLFPHWVINSLMSKTFSGSLLYCLCLDHSRNLMSICELGALVPQRGSGPTVGSDPGLENS